MDIRIEFERSSSLPDINRITLEMPDGTDRTFELDEQAIARTDHDRQVMVMSIRSRDGYTPLFEDLSKARVLDINAGGTVVKNLSVHALRSDRSAPVPMDLYSDRFPSDIPWADVDRGARHMVRYFNNNGLPTKASCSGHPGTPKKQFYIDFQDSVTVGGIAGFMRSHAVKNGAFRSHGAFHARYGQYNDGQITETLGYTAADLLDAALDLNDWVADDMSGQPGNGGMDAVPWDRDRDAAKIAAANMDPAVADALYRAVWKDRVLEDIDTWLENHDETLAPDQKDYAASRYVYDGKYDCNLSYWENIANVVQLAREFA